MENPEEILHSLEEFAKLKPKDIPRELEEYLCFVAKTGDPVYQWSLIKSLFREKLINVITEFYESCPSVDVPPCPNVDIFNYDTMKNFILEKLDTFVAAPFTVQRICELLTTPRKEYNRIDKYMRALEKNILVVSTTEPGNHRTPENGEGFVNGIETEHIQDSTNDINIEEMDDTPAWNAKSNLENVSFQSTSKSDMIIDTFTAESSTNVEEISTSVDTVITCCPSEEYVSIEPVNSDIGKEEVNSSEGDVSVTITAIPAAVQKRRDSIEPPSEQATNEKQSEDELEPADILKDSTEVPVCTKNEEEIVESTETQEEKPSESVLTEESTEPEIPKVPSPEQPPIIDSTEEIEKPIADQEQEIEEPQTSITPETTEEIETPSTSEIIEESLPSTHEEIEKSEILVESTVSDESKIEPIKAQAEEEESIAENKEAEPLLITEIPSETILPEIPIIDVPDTTENTETPMEVDVPSTDTAEPTTEEK